MIQRRSTLGATHELNARQRRPRERTDMQLSYLPWVSPAAGSDRPCMGDAVRTFSYREVEDRATAFAEQLTARGIGAGDVLAIMLPNSLELLIGMLGAWCVGAAVTPVNPTFTARELDYQLADSGEIGRAHV